MKIEDIFLRALEPSDIKILMQLENDESYWKYSNTTEPFSEKILTSFIAEQKRDIFEVKQKRYVISCQKIPTLGFIDLFNFEPLHRRAGVGIIIIEKFIQCFCNIMSKKMFISKKMLGISIKLAK